MSSSSSGGGAAFFAGAAAAGAAAATTNLGRSLNQTLDISVGERLLEEAPIKASLAPSRCQHLVDGRLKREERGWDEGQESVRSRGQVQKVYGKGARGSERKGS
jgi:hypothetical protein